MKSIAVILIISYLLMCFLLFLFQRSFLYFPQGASTNVNLPEVVFDVGDLTIHGWVINPEAESAIIYYGGNAESVEYNVDFFSRVLNNYAVYLIPYRGYGNNSGEPKELDLYQDALKIFDEISQKHTDVSLIGRSLGTGIATHVADNRKIARLCLITPYDSMEMMAKHHYPIFPVSILVTDKYPSIERAPRIKAKTLLLIAAEDKVIPPERSEKLAAAFPQSLVNKQIIQSANHNDISLYPEFDEYMSEFFAK